MYISTNVYKLNAMTYSKTSAIIYSKTATPAICLEYSGKVRCKIINLYNSILVDMCYVFLEYIYFLYFLYFLHNSSSDHNIVIMVVLYNINFQ